MRAPLALLVLGLAACSGGGASTGDCTPLTCPALGATCGSFPDGCGTALACGACTTAGTVCGGGGVPGVCAARLCTPDGWCWDNPLPQGNPLFAVSGLAKGDVWAAGPAGTMLHFDGARWSALRVPGFLLLQDLFPVAADDAWAVGAQGVIIRWRGGQWVSVDSTVQDTLSGVWGAAPDDVWAVGTAGVILHFDGQSWSKVQSPTTANLFGIWGSGATDIIAVGANATMLHYDGRSFTPDPPPTTQDLLSVWGRSKDDVWATGRGGALIHRLNGGWLSVSSGTTRNLAAFWAGSATDLHAVGFGGLLLEGDGTAFRTAILAPPPMPAGGVPETLEDIWGSGADAWIAGGRGSLFRRVAGHWYQPASQRPDALLGVWAGGGVAVAVGTGGTAIRSEGAGFEALDVSGDVRTVRGVWGSGADDVWAVGDEGLMAHIIGKRFVTVSAGTIQSLSGIHGRAADDVWAVGEGGIIVHLLGTGGWSGVPSSVSRSLDGVFARTADDAWAVGDGATILRWDGQTWKASSAGGATAHLHAVWADSGTSAFAVGDAGTILRWTGSAWQPEASGTTDELFGVWGTGPDDVWAAGGGPFEYGGATVLHRDPTGWHAADTGAIASLRAVTIGNGHVTVAGVGGTILSK